MSGMFYIRFALCLFFCAFLAYIGGYDFKERNFWVAYGAVVAVIVSFSVALSLED